MDYYSNYLTVDVHDIDHNGVASASSLMRYIQSAAQSQLTDKGLSYDRLRELNRAFILSRITLEFNESVRAYDRLEAMTFPCHSHAFTFLRCYQLKRGDDIIGRAVSAWALVDTEKHSLVKVNDFELGIKTYAPLDLALARIVMPCELTKIGKYHVNYGDIDQNKHMNNTKYPDMYSNFLPLDGKRIDKITISYLNEAPMGSILTVDRAFSDDNYYFRTTRADGKVNSEAKIHLTSI